MTLPVRVAVDAPLAVGDAALTYAAAEVPPPGSAALVAVGARLQVGYVLGADAQTQRALRPLIAPLPEIPPLPPDLLALAEWMADRYLCSTGEALAAMLPPGLMRRARLTVAGDADDLPRTVRRKPGRAMDVDALRRALGPGAAATLSRLVSAGRVHLAIALPAASVPPPVGHRVRLRVHPALWSPGTAGAQRVLLLGTERQGTYVAAVAETIHRRQPVLAVFASVAAAARFAARVRDVLGVTVALLHADLTEEERLARWLAVQRGMVPVVVGTRGAVFAPVERVGLIIVDEEGDVGHREERVPRYHVRDVARRRAADAVVLFADEVPTAETYAAVSVPRARVLRPPAAAGPRVVLVDLRTRDGPAAPGEALSPPLVAALERALREGGRALLFVQRKGYAGLILCAECGYSPHCPRCDVPLALDAGVRGLHCRYCRDRFAPPSVCPRCGGRAFGVRGSGTQRIARLARVLGPVPIHRLDSDAARTPEAAARILRDFRDRGGVLVATALVLEAEEPPRVDLSAVVLADAVLRYPDYRAPERGLRTLWQVRGLARSWCVVQTYTPDHPALVALRRRDLRHFYREELIVRRRFSYPPYGEILAVELVGGEELAAAAAASLAAAVGDQAEVLGPALLRRGRRHGWQVVFKAAGGVPRGPLSAWLRHPPRGVRVAVDVDP